MANTLNQTANQNKKSKQKIKTITNVKDLEDVKPLDKIEVTYSCGANLFDSESLSTSKGIYSGSFEINNEKYFVISTMKPSATYLGLYFLNSSLYKIADKAIINMVHAINGYCDGEDKPSLEAAIKRHVKTLNASKLGELSTTTKQEQDNKQ